MRDEDARHARGVRWIDSVAADVRFAFRFFARDYVIRTAVPASDLAVSIRRIAREGLPTTPIDPLWTLAQRETAYRRTERKIQAGAAAIGVLVLLLSSIGLYGAVALGVGQRRREIGIRMALGARAGQVVAMFYAGGVRLGIVGLGLGLPVSLVVHHFLIGRKELVVDERTPSMVLIGGIIAAAVLVVASVATLVPATRAARVNPVTALRSE